MAKTYYRKIKGVKYDRELLEAADKAISGKGDGRISRSDAEKVLKQVKDSGVYSDVEKRTMAYIRDHYQFTEGADTWFRTEVRKWAAVKSSPKKTVAKKAVKKKSTAKKPAIKKAVKKKSVKSEFLRPMSMPEAAAAKTEALPKTTVPASAKEEIQKPSKFGALVVAILFVAAVIVVIVLPKMLKTRGGQADTIKPDQQTKKLSEKEVKKSKTATVGKTETKAATQNYTIKYGDTLKSIAKKYYGNDDEWKRIYDANRGVLKSPGLIIVGTKIIIPARK